MERRRNNLYIQFSCANSAQIETMFRASDGQFGIIDDYIEFVIKIRGFVRQTSGSVKTK